MKVQVPCPSAGQFASRGHREVERSRSRRAMSARASRLRLEEELRNVAEQEARLDEEVNLLLQVSLLVCTPRLCEQDRPPP